MRGSGVALPLILSPGGSKSRSGGNRGRSKRFIMQFIVFAAFAIVLSVPNDGPPWKTLPGPAWAAAFVVGQVALTGLVAWLYAHLVRLKLEREPAWLPGAQHRLAQAGVAVRIALIVGFSAGVYLTDWTRYVRGVAWMKPIYGLDEMVILSPFLVSVMLAWLVLYPADRAIRQVSLELRLWAAQPARPVWQLASYLAFMFRHHVLIILAPMVPIVATIDLVSNEHLGPRIRRATGILWADQAVLVIVAGAVFLVAPVLLRFIWHTRALPAGELRERLDRLCRSVGLRYRQILIWESDGMVVNAAVMGLVRPVRYILLSDGLIETMDDVQIEAVFGHEAGHVKHHHITFYLMFAIVSMLIVGGVNEVIVRFWPGLLRDHALAGDYMQVTAMGLILAVWGIGFGPVSRRFEWQADLFGARSVTPSIPACDRPCLYHGTAGTASPAAGRVQPLCATAAHVFGDALHRIAVLNGIPVEARSWRHSSIANRIELLRRYGRDPAAIAQLHRAVITIKAILLVTTVGGLAIATWLYWPKQFVDHLLHR